MYSPPTIKGGMGETQKKAEINNNEHIAINKARVFFLTVCNNR
jgi:hypothetical protein